MLQVPLCLLRRAAHLAFLEPDSFTETDQAKEFNPANVSFHPVLASSSATIGNTGNVAAPWTRTSLMTCTDCHESDVTTDPTVRTGPRASSS